MERDAKLAIATGFFYMRDIRMRRPAQSGCGKELQSPATKIFASDVARRASARPH